jgi:hypothetical protein
MIIQGSMQKIVLYFSLFIFHFSLCFAQDTLVYKTGEKVAVKVFYVNGDKVIYTFPPGKKQEIVKLSELDYLKYEDGNKYSEELQAKQDSIDYVLKAKQDSIDRVNKPYYRPININIGFGYSPEFDGDLVIATPFFPVQKDAEYFLCSNIVPNLGGAIDYAVDKRFSIGLAASYQSEMISHEETPYNDEISRINTAIRFLYHLNKNNLHFDNYIGLRVGCSHWHDNPSLTSAYQNVSYSIPIFYFIGSANLLVPSFQFLYGIRLYGSGGFGFHFEVGIGSPYLIEGGITFRFKTRKEKLK